MSVPVLSKMKALMRAASSMSATFLINTPSRAAAESAATIAVGVARMTAHGQATMKTAMTRLISPVKAHTSAPMINTNGV